MASSNLAGMRWRQLPRPSRLRPQPWPGPRQPRAGRVGETARAGAVGSRDPGRAAAAGVCTGAADAQAAPRSRPGIEAVGEVRKRGSRLPERMRGFRKGAYFPDRHRGRRRRRGQEKWDISHILRRLKDRYKVATHKRQGVRGYGCNSSALICHIMFQELHEWYAPNHRVYRACLAAAGCSTSHCHGSCFLENPRLVRS